MAFGHDKNAWGRVNGQIWRRELRSRARPGMTPLLARA